MCNYYNLDIHTFEYGHIHWTYVQGKKAEDQIILQQKKNLILNVFNFILGTTRLKSI